MRTLQQDAVTLPHIIHRNHHFWLRYSAYYCGSFCATLCGFERTSSLSSSPGMPSSAPTSFAKDAILSIARGNTAVIYSLDQSLKLPTQHPARSGHDRVLALYVLSGPRAARATGRALLGAGPTDTGTECASLYCCLAAPGPPTHQDRQWHA
jgi:hypothetical protein